MSFEGSWTDSRSMCAIKADCAENRCAGIGQRRRSRRSRCRTRAQPEPRNRRGPRRGARLRRRRHHQTRARQRRARTTRCCSCSAGPAAHWPAPASTRSSSRRRRPARSRARASARSTWRGSAAAPPRSPRSAGRPAMRLSAHSCRCPLRPGTSSSGTSALNPQLQWERLFQGSSHPTSRAGSCRHSPLGIPGCPAAARVQMLCSMRRVMRTEGTSGRSAWPVRLRAVTTAEAKPSRQTCHAWLQVSKSLCCTLEEPT